MQTSSRQVCQTHVCSLIWVFHFGPGVNSKELRQSLGNIPSQLRCVVGVIVLVVATECSFHWPHPEISPLRVQHSRPSVAILSQAMLSRICDTNARASHVLDKSQLGLVTRTTEIAKLHLDIAYIRFVRADPQCAILQIYGNDGTPVRVNVFNRAHAVGAKRVRTEGGSGIELLVQICFARKVVGGRLESALRLVDPLPLTHGKTAKAIFSASLAFFKGLRALGHKGIAIEVKIFDRAVFQAMHLLYSQYHMQRHMATTALHGDADRLLHYLMEWPIHIPCVLHDLQNAQKWSLLHWFSDSALLKDIHIGIESLRNGYDLLLKHLAGFICRRLEFVDSCQLPSEDIAHQLWATLGAEPEVLEYMVTHGVIFKEGRLLIDRRCKDAFKLDDLTGALLALWRFRPFTDSRWLTLGRASRPIAAGFITGLATFVGEIIAMPHESNFYIGGFRRLLEDVPKEFIMTTAVTSWVLDEVFEVVLADDRLLRMHEQVTEVLRDEVEHLGDIAEEVWELLVAGIGGEVPAEHLRSGVIAAGHIAYGFFWFRSLRRLDSLPFSIARGDVAQNLHDLADGDVPDEVVSAKIHTLLTKGMVLVPRVLAAVERFRDISFSNRIVEQVHAHAATSCRYHSRYGVETVRVRSFVSLLNVAVPRLFGRRLTITAHTHIPKWCPW